MRPQNGWLVFFGKTHIHRYTAVIVDVFVENFRTTTTTNPGNRRGFCVRSQKKKEYSKISHFKISDFSLFSIFHFMKVFFFQISFLFSFFPNNGFFFFLCFFFSFKYTSLHVSISEFNCTSFSCFPPFFSPVFCLFSCLKLFHFSHFLFISSFFLIF